MDEDTITSGVTMSIPTYVNASFEPLPDITAYELAKLLPWFFGRRSMTIEDWDKLGTIQRHFVRYG